MGVGILVVMPTGQCFSLKHDEARMLLVVVLLGIMLARQNEQPFCSRKVRIKSARIESTKWTASSISLLGRCFDYSYNRPREV